MKIMLLLLLCGCDTSYDRGMRANIQTREEYVQFRGENPGWNPDQNLPYKFDPEKGGWGKLGVVERNQHGGN